ncbi:MAG TPA: hypothetical protein ENH00_09145 [Actinobacteria bacterium]|nr:hypothetical protein [Actinomycetota bacterium]
MRSYTVRDHRSHYPQTLSIINLRTSAYEKLRSHPRRAEAAVSGFLEDEPELLRALNELDLDSPQEDRMTEDEWSAKEQSLRSLGFSEGDIETLRRKRGPTASGVEQTRRDVERNVLEVAKGRGILERAALLDPTGLRDRRTVRDAAADASTETERDALLLAVDRAALLGVAELSVTLQFPILLASYGYTRQHRDPEKSTLRSFTTRNAYGGKTPIFAVAADTEALVVQMSAKDVLDWLFSTGHVAEAPASEREARLGVLEVFASGGEAADRVRVLTHSLSHVLLRALDDGQSGFGESSLAEWLVPETLTFALYVSSYQAYTLGAFWTLLHSRVSAWMDHAQDAIARCDNDPLCHLRIPRACERCMYLTFGCNQFNDGLSREDLMDFVRWRAQS